MFTARTVTTVIVAYSVLVGSSTAMADTFGTGANQFTLDFVPISGATNPSSGIPAGDGLTFVGVNHDYRMGTYEITNDQWNKFTASLGVPVTGSPSTAYDSGSYDWGTGTTSVPTNRVSWYEAAQFVNWLNTNTNHEPAYKFTGTQGTSDYTFVDWSPSDPGYDVSNPYRNKNAFYFVPTENEWVKAAYWNGTMLQQYATKAGETLFQGNGMNGGWNYFDGDEGPDGPINGPWNVGTGSQELNGTYDMMGNNWEWIESPYNDPAYGAGSGRSLRSGNWYSVSDGLQSSYRHGLHPAYQCNDLGFRVASVPEPGSIALLLSGAAVMLLYQWRKRA